jgi:hypothetical protein
MRQVTKDDINSIKFILNSYADKKKLIEMQLQKYYINEEFMIEFGEYVPSDVFSKSVGLSYQMIKSYPDKFAIDQWMWIKDKSLEPLLHDEFLSTLTDQQLEDILVNTSSKNFTPEIFDKYFNSSRVSDRVKSIIINLVADSLSDEVLMKNVSMLDYSVFEDSDRKWSKELIESLFRNRKLDMRFFISGLLKSDDLGFVIRMVNDSSLEFVVNQQTFDREIIAMLNYLPQKHYLVLFDKIKTYASNALTYNVLSHLLETNDFLEEEFFLENIDIFKNLSISGKVATYARSRDYRQLLLLLKLNQ